MLAADTKIFPLVIVFETTSTKEFVSLEPLFRNVRKRCRGIFSPLFLAFGSGGIGGTRRELLEHTLPQLTIAQYH
jgi:hypothetical protein